MLLLMLRPVSPEMIRRLPCPCRRLQNRFVDAGCRRGGGRHLPRGAAVHLPHRRRVPPDTDDVPQVRQGGETRSGTPCFVI